MPSPLIIGHRGFAARFPENTVAGVVAALEVGADGVEVDIRQSADGSWVCHHDRSRGGRPVRQWNDAALAREGVPTLATLAAAVPADRSLFVEVKPLPEGDLLEGLETLTRIFRQRIAGARVISSSVAVLQVIRRALPRLPVSLVFNAIPESLPEGVELSPFHRLVETVLPFGRPLHPWTVDRPSRMRELVRLGVASITTNNPRLALEVLGG